MLIANIANISQVQAITIITLNIYPTDSNKEATINFIATLCEITLSGRRVLSNLKIFIAGKLTLTKNISSDEVITIKKSS